MQTCTLQGSGVCLSLDICIRSKGPYNFSGHGGTFAAQILCMVTLLLQRHCLVVLLLHEKTLVVLPLQSHCLWYFCCTRNMVVLCRRLIGIYYFYCAKLTLVVSLLRNDYVAIFASIYRLALFHATHMIK